VFGRRQMELARCECKQVWHAIFTVARIGGLYPVGIRFGGHGRLNQANREFGNDSRDVMCEYKEGNVGQRAREHQVEAFLLWLQVGLAWQWQLKMAPGINAPPKFNILFSSWQESCFGVVRSKMYCDLLHPRHDRVAIFVVKTFRHRGQCRTVLLPSPMAVGVRASARSFARKSVRVLSSSRSLS